MGHPLGARAHKGRHPDLEAQFDFAPDTTMPAAAQATVAAAQALYGSAAANVVRTAFEARGIL